MLTSPPLLEDDPVRDASRDSSDAGLWRWMRRKELFDCERSRTDDRRHGRTRVVTPYDRDNHDEQTSSS